MRNWKSLYIKPLFFYVFGGIVCFFALSHAFPVLLFPAQLTLTAYALLCLAEVYLLFGSGIKVSSTREMAKVFSLGDKNTIRLKIQNESNHELDCSLIEELPEQLQKRDFLETFKLLPGELKTFTYEIEPKERGRYAFFHSLIFVSGKFRLFERKIVTGNSAEVAVYPSIAQVKKYQIKSNATFSLNGMKKIRRIGHNYEFDHIKNYVVGDDYRSINWKMTGKQNALMVNQYDEEKSQQIYCIIDNGRSMGMPFNGLSLHDYSINAALVVANTAVQKQDKAGLITFSKKIDSYLKADASNGQVQKVFQYLYNEKQNDKEANFELLYTFLRRTVNSRSLLFLYSNFESIYSVQRVLPILRMLNKRHLLVVVLFENDELKTFAAQEPDADDKIYTTAIAEKMVNDKKQLASILRQHGINTILTSPQSLTVNTLNKYLELKARGLS